MKKIISIIFVFLFLLILFNFSYVSAGEIVLSPLGGDYLGGGYVDSWNPANTFIGAVLIVSSGIGRDYRGYMKWNLSKIGFGKEIISVKLNMRYTNVLSGDPFVNLSVSHLYNSVSWNENNFIWNNQPCGSSGTTLDSSNCNPTPEKTYVFNGFDHHYGDTINWSILSMFKNDYSLGYENFSIVFWVHDSSGGGYVFTEPKLYITYVGEDEEGVEDEEVNYGNNGKEITKVIIKEIESNKTFCGDGVCQEEGNFYGIKESFWNCPSDCKSADLDEFFYYFTKNCWDNDPNTTCLFGFGNKKVEEVTVCGDEVCEGLESPFNCKIDCGNFGIDKLIGKSCSDNDSLTYCFWGSKESSSVLAILIILLPIFTMLKIRLPGSRVKTTLYRYLKVKIKSRRIFL